MKSFRDPFLTAVVVITAIIVSLMGIIRLRMTPVTENHLPVKEIVHLPSRGPFRITRVIDGDTIILDNGEKVRLIGIDTPEIHHSELPVQRFGQEAAEFLKKLTEGRECTLEYEPRQVRDYYGRLLAYVYADDLLVNAELIRRGYAFAYTSFPFKRREEFIGLEREARSRQYGLWNFSLRNGRFTNLITRYESLNLEGRKKFDEALDGLVEEYPVSKVERTELRIEH